MLFRPLFAILFGLFLFAGSLDVLPRAGAEEVVIRRPLAARRVVTVKRFYRPAPAQVTVKRFQYRPYVTRVRVRW
jgi:hypothetical protein